MEHTFHLDPAFKMNCTGFGCKVVTESLLGHLPHIKFCPLHAGAGKLRDTAKTVLDSYNREKTVRHIYMVELDKVCQATEAP